MIFRLKIQKLGRWRKERVFFNYFLGISKEKVHELNYQLRNVKKI